MIPVTSPPSRRDRITGHAMIAAAVVALVVVAAESARQSMALPAEEPAPATSSTDTGRAVPATLQPATLPTPAPVTDNAHAVGAVEYPAGATASGPAMATLNVDVTRAVAVGPAFPASAPLGDGTVTHEPSSAISASPSPATAWSSDGPGPSPVSPTDPPAPEPTPVPTPKPTQKPHPTHPAHPQAPTPTPTPTPSATDSSEPEPEP